MSSDESESEYNSSDEEVSFVTNLSFLFYRCTKLPGFNLSFLTCFLSQLQEAFAKGLLKPGLNAVIETTKREKKNNVVSFIFCFGVYMTEALTIKCSNVFKQSMASATLPIIVCIQN